MKKISVNILFNIFLLSFLLGIFVNNIIFEYILTLIIFFSLSVFLLNLIIYFRKTKKYLVYLLIFSLSFLPGIYISDLYISKIEENEKIINFYDSGFNNDITIEVLNLYKSKNHNNEYIVKLVNINNKNLSDEKILGIVQIAKNFEINKGDILNSSSKIIKIKNFNKFDYEKFMYSKGIYFKSYFPYINKKGEVKTNFILKEIYNLREKSIDIIYEIYPKNEAIFLAGILLGAREDLPNELKQNFNNSGLTHFIAVSGFNITILIIFFSYIFKFFPVFFRTIFITIVIILFTFLVGDTAPVIRASIMGLVAYYILVSGRKGNIITILLLTAFLMSLFSPLILNYDISFALSFLAVIGIVFTQKFWKKVFHFVPELLAIREAFVLTMAALTFTLPLMLFNFGQVSILAPFANVLVTWTIPIAMLLGFFSIILYTINPFFGFIIGYFDWIFLKWDMIVVDFFGTKSFSIFKYDFGEGGVYLQIMYFVILIFIIILMKTKPKNLLDFENEKLKK